jgi:polar amino acid transport system permease protein
MSFEFSGTLSRWQEFAQGAVMTVALSLAGMVLGLVVGVVGAALRSSRIWPLRVLVGGYVEIIRNTPFLVQIYIVYFGLPSLGMRLTPVTASVLSMTIYVGAYLIETLRAGLEGVPKEQTEAARALGLNKLGIFRLVVLPQGLASVYPALVSQFILLLLASSIASSVSTQELTGAANDVQGQTFRSFEAFIVVAVVYLVLTSVLRVALGALDRRLFRFRYVGR